MTTGFFDWPLVKLNTVNVTQDEESQMIDGVLDLLESLLAN